MLPARCLRRFRRRIGSRGCAAPTTFPGLYGGSDPAETSSAGPVLSVTGEYIFQDRSINVDARELVSPPIFIAPQQRGMRSSRIFAANFRK